MTSQGGDASQVDEEENEPAECECKYCEMPGLIEHMVQCPKFDEEIERGIYDPGWIHKECCENEFKENLSDCLDYCDEQHYLTYLKDITNELVNLTDLEMTDFKGAKSYISKDHTYMLSFEMNKLVESFRPLNIVDDVFEDVNEDILYIKDNMKNMQQYSLFNYKDIFERLEKIKKSYLSYDLYCVKNGPLFIKYDVGAISIGGAISPQNIGEKIDAPEIIRNLKDHYRYGETFFEFVLEPNVTELKAAIQSFSEDEYIRVVLCPLLQKMGYRNVSSVSFHGAGEGGADIRPFYKLNEFGNIIYYGSQAKAEKIHAKAGTEKGNVNKLINQIDELLRTPFISFIDNSEKKVGHVYIFNSQEITADAKIQLFSQYQNRSNINIIEIDEVVRATMEYKLTEDIMRYYHEKSRNAK